MKKTSRISGFYNRTPEERREIVAELCGLKTEDLAPVFDTGGFPLDVADNMIENVIGGFTLPLGIATNFRIDDEDVLIPMAVEEPSVVAAASNGAKIARAAGGFHTDCDPSIMIGQVQVVDLPDTGEAVSRLDSRKDELIDKANEADPVLVKHGGGAQEVRIRELDTLSGPMIVVHLLVNCRDAMGANAVNTMAERVAPLIEEMTGGRTLLRIISNLAVHRVYRARAVFRKEQLGEEALNNILLAYHFAEADPFRAATHNKGIMNGVTAMVRATGNDTRAVEAGAHSYASRKGRYTPLSSYEIDDNGDLLGRIAIPLSIGTIGGGTRSHPHAKVCMKILGISSARRLGGVMASLGLAQNFAAMRALADEGIQRGHMKLHARNVAVSAGAEGEMIDRVARRMIEEGEINEARARVALGELG